MSFITLGIFWSGQQTQLNHIGEGSRDLTWIHLAFLFAITFMAALHAPAAEFITYRSALLIYWLNILLLGAMLYWSWSYASRHGLIKEDTPAEVRSSICRRILIAPVAVCRWRGIVRNQHIREHRRDCAGAVELRDRATVGTEEQLVAFSCSPERATPRYRNSTTMTAADKNAR